MIDISIGDLARRTGVKVPTIRYYEGVGLMHAAARTSGRQRRYTPTEVARLSFICHARELGFGIDAIRELVGLSTQPGRSCADVDAIASRHLSEVDRRIAHLTSLQTELRRMLTQCGKGQVGDCRVIEVLAGPIRPPRED